MWGCNFECWAYLVTYRNHDRLESGGLANATSKRKPVHKLMNKALSDPVYISTVLFDFNLNALLVASIMTSVAAKSPKNSSLCSRKMPSFDSTISPPNNLPSPLAVPFIPFETTRVIARTTDGQSRAWHMNHDDKMMTCAIIFNLILYNIPQVQTIDLQGREKLLCLYRKRQHFQENIS